MQQNTHIPPRYSIKDYNQWPGDWELIGGYPYAISPSPFPKHQLISANLVAFFNETFRNSKSDCLCKVLSETDWVIDDDTVVRPNVMVVCGLFDPNDFIRNPPVLIVEIFSATTRLKDRNLKFSLYQQCGVKYYLMADPDAKTIEAFELVNNRYAQLNAPLQFALTKNCTVTLQEERIFEA
ncbi:MAG: Uma2 family endonuclease [Chitinophagaceae bacterium]